MICTVFYCGGPLDGLKIVKPNKVSLRLFEQIQLRAGDYAIRVAYSIRWLGGDFYIAQYIGEYFT